MGQPGAGGDDAGAKRHPLVRLGEPRRTQHHLAVAGEQPVPEGGHLRATRADAQRARALGLACSAKGAVEGVRDDPTGVRHRRRGMIHVLVAEQRGDGVVVVAAQPVTAPTGDDVHGVAHVEQELRGPRRPRRAAGRRATPRRGRRARSCRAGRRGPP